MRRYIISLFLGVVCILHKIRAQPQATPPPVDPTALQAQQPPQLGTAGPAGPGGPGGDVDSAIQMLYSQIPTIITACSQIKTQVEQGLGYVPNTSSPVPLIIQYIELQDIQVACDMITQTKQLADQLQSAGMGGQGQDPTLSAQNPAQMPQNPLPATA